MIRITTSLEAQEIIRALHGQPRDVLLNFTTNLVTTCPDSSLLEELADVVLAELERRASST